MADEQLKQQTLFNPSTDANAKNLYHVDKWVSGTEGASGVYETRRVREANLNIYNYVEVPLSSAQILALNWDTGLSILSAPGANKYFSDIKILFEFTAGATSYTFSDGAKWLDFYYAGKDNFFNNNLIAGTDDKVGIIEIPVLKSVDGTEDGNSDSSTKPFTQTLANMNSALELFFGTTVDAEISDGDGTVLLKIWYKVETFGA